LADDRGEWIAVGHSFSKGGQVRSDVEKLLRPAVGKAKSCDGFVKDEERAMLARKFLDGLQKPLLRPINIHGFQNDRCAFPRVGFENGVQGIEIVIGERMGQSLYTFRNAPVARG